MNERHSNSFPATSVSDHVHVWLLGLPESGRRALQQQGAEHRVRWHHIERLDELSEPLPSAVGHVVVLDDACMRAGVRYACLRHVEAQRLALLVWADSATPERMESLFGLGADDVLCTSAPALAARRLAQWCDTLEARKGLGIWRDMQRVEHLKNEFMATIHHELRTPLTSIVGALSLLDAKVGGELPAKAQFLVEMAQRNAQRLSRLIDDVLDITRLEEEQVGLSLALHPLRGLLVDSVQATAPMADRADVRLELGAIDDVAVRVDADRFAQVVANLLSNAIRHSRSGQSVFIKAAVHGPDVSIQVVDQGPGIPETFRKRLFQKFAQADGSDRRDGGGTGLGLYITRLLVERMGGRICVSSPPGVGATFTVCLPVVQEAAEVAGSMHG